MKRSILVMMAVVLALAARADYSYLNFVTQDGSETSFTAVGAKITFADGQALVEQDGTTTTFALSDLAEMYFTNTLAGIGSVEVESAQEGQYYDLQGRAVQKPEKGIFIVDGKKVVK